MRLLAHLGSLCTGLLLALLLFMAGLVPHAHATGPTPEPQQPIVTPHGDDDLLALVETILAAYRANAPPAVANDPIIIITIETPGHQVTGFLVLDDASGQSAGFVLYAYAGGDPVNRWDPSGLDDVWLMPSSNGKPFVLLDIEYRTLFGALRSHRANFNFGRQIGDHVYWREGGVPMRVYLPALRRRLAERVASGGSPSPTTVNERMAWAEQIRNELAMPAPTSIDPVTGLRAPYSGTPPPLLRAMDGTGCGWGDDSNVVDLCRAWQGPFLYFGGPGNDQEYNPEHLQGIWNLRTESFQSSAYGSDMNDLVEAMYRDVCRNWRPGMEIVLVGGSRGAAGINELAWLIHERGTQGPYFAAPGTVSVRLMVQLDTVYAVGAPGAGNEWGHTFPCEPLEGIGRGWLATGYLIPSNVQRAVVLNAADERRTWLEISFPIHQDSTSFVNLVLPGNHGDAVGFRDDWRDRNRVGVNQSLSDAYRHIAAIEILRAGLPVNPEGNVLPNFSNYMGELLLHPNSWDGTPPGSAQGGMGMQTGPLQRRGFNPNLWLAQDQATWNRWTRVLPGQSVYSVLEDYEP